MPAWRFLRARVEQDYAKKIATWAEFFAGTDFVSLLGVGRWGEEGIETFFFCMLFQFVGEQEDGSFMVLVLPGGEEQVGGGQRGDVILIDAQRSGSAARRAQRGARCGEDQKQ